MHRNAVSSKVQVETDGATSARLSDAVPDSDVEFQEELRRLLACLPDDQPASQPSLSGLFDFKRSGPKGEADDRFPLTVPGLVLDGVQTARALAGKRHASINDVGRWGLHEGLNRFEMLDVIHTICNARSAVLISGDENLKT